MSTELAKKTEIVPADYDSWSDTDGDGRVIQGTLVKCVDGVWSPTALPKRLVVLGTATIIQLWQGQKPVQTYIKQAGKPWPNLDDLNAEIPEEDWEIGLDGKPRAPWQRQFIVYLLDPNTAESFTYANGVAGASIAVTELKNSVKWQRALRGDHVVPVVELQSRPMKTKFGMKQRPYFHIVEWRNMDVGFTPPTAQAQLQLTPPDDGVPFNDDLPTDLAS